MNRSSWPSSPACTTASRMALQLPLRIPHCGRAPRWLQSGCVDQVGDDLDGHPSPTTSGMPSARRTSIRHPSASRGTRCMLTPFREKSWVQHSGYRKALSPCGASCFPSVRTLAAQTTLRRVSHQEDRLAGRARLARCSFRALRRRQSCWSYNLRGWEVAVALSLRNVQGKIVYWTRLRARSAPTHGRSGPRDLRRLWTNTGRVKVVARSTSRRRHPFFR